MKISKLKSDFLISLESGFFSCRSMKLYFQKKKNSTHISERGGRPYYLWNIKTVCDLSIRHTMRHLFRADEGRWECIADWPSSDFHSLFIVNNKQHKKFTCLFLAVEWWCCEMNAIKNQAILVICYRQRGYFWLSPPFASS